MTNSKKVLVCSGAELRVRRGVNEYHLFVRHVQNDTEHPYHAFPDVFLLEYWFANPDVQIDWMRTAAQVNANHGVIPSVLRQSTGFKAFMAEVNYLPTPSLRAPASSARRLIWQNMGKLEQVKWYMWKKQPLFECFVDRMVRMMRVSGVFKHSITDENILEIVARFAIAGPVPAATWSDSLLRSDCALMAGVMGQ